MLEIDRLHKSFGDRHALNGVSLSVEPGEVYGFVGANGAGKTTTMRVVMGALQADSGDVRWKDRAIDLDVRRTIGYMPEERGLYPRMKVRNQLRYFAPAARRDGRRRRSGRLDRTPGHRPVRRR